MGPQLAQNLLSVCKYLSYPGKLLSLHSSNQLSFLIENEVSETPVGIQQKPEPDYRMRCFSPDNFDATSIQPCTKCGSKVKSQLESYKIAISFSDEFYWNNFTHPKDSLVDLEFLFQILGITEFNFEVSGSLVMRPTGSNSILFTTTNEPIIDTWCELALGNMIFHTRNNIFFLD